MRPLGPSEGSSNLVVVGTTYNIMTNVSLPSQHLRRFSTVKYSKFDERVTFQYNFYLVQFERIKPTI